jgi:L-asparaginase
MEQRLRHNCSGNHLAFLALSAHRGWDMAGYRDPRHPSQLAALTEVAGAAGVAAESVGTCVDGCGVVCFALPLQAIAALYARLPVRLPRQLAAMTTHPQMVAANGDLDTELMRALPGCAAKSGAEGLGCVALADSGLGIAVRVEDGSSRAVAPAVMAVLSQLLGWDSPPGSLVEFVRPDIRNTPGDIVGFLRASVTLDSVD